MCESQMCCMSDATAELCTTTEPLHIAMDCKETHVFVCGIHSLLPAVMNTVLHERGLSPVMKLSVLCSALLHHQ